LFITAHVPGTKRSKIILRMTEELTSIRKERIAHLKVLIAQTEQPELQETDTEVDMIFDQVVQDVVDSICAKVSANSPTLLSLELGIKLFSITIEWCVKFNHSLASIAILISISSY
jgi:hypothetical protein